MPDFKWKTTEFAETSGTRGIWHPNNLWSYDYRADLYSTESFCIKRVGRFPFSGENWEMDKKRRWKIEEIEGVGGAPEFLEKALHRQLPERHQNATEMYDELDRIRRDEYVKQASQLIDASVNSSNPRLAEALERYRKIFRLPLEAAERMNQNLFFQRRQKEEASKREKLITQFHKHYSVAARYIENQNYSGVLEEIHKATRLCVDDQD